MKIVLCHGKFDVLHAGHIAFLEEAATLGDKLVVSITADAYLPDPSYFNTHERKKALEALSCVNEVNICEDETGITAIDNYEPAVYAKGPDYTNSRNEVLQQEKEAVEKYGGSLVILQPNVVFSSTKVKNEHQPFVDIFDDGYSINIITDFILKVKRLVVTVAGETIMDEFQTVELDGQSAKSSCPSFTIVGDKETQYGGAAVISQHVDNFCNSHYLHRINWITKLRYIDRFRNKKHFEVKTIIPQNVPDTDLTLTENQTDLTLVADFGHGLLSNAKLIDNIYLVVQTNSSNFGYNLVNKWNAYRSKLVCLDRVEGSLLIGKKFETITKKVLQQIYSCLNTEVIILTAHKGGSAYYDGTNSYVVCPAFAQHVVDTIGAGDAFFTFASLAHHLKFPPDEILLIASIAAAITTQWLCNASSVTPKKLLETAKVIL